MKLGIIIIFNSFDCSTLKDQLIETIKSLNDVCFCLVNNNSNEETDNYLNEISHKCDNTNVINIKKSKSLNSAIRAGARFMINRHNLNQLGYINNSTNLKLIEVIKVFKSNQEEIIDLVVNEQNKKPIRQTLFQRLFPIKKYLIDLKVLV
jgi:hypothetical protein